MKAVWIIRGKGKVRVWVACGDGVKHYLPHIERHSPDGFEYGYGGSGPAALALSILHNFYGQEIANAVYQQFKWDFIAPLERSTNHVIKASEIHAWVLRELRRLNDKALLNTVLGILELEEVA